MTVSVKPIEFRDFRGGCPNTTQSRKAGDPGLIPGRSGRVIFGVNTHGQRLTLLTCAVGRIVLSVTHIDMPCT